MSYLNLTFQWYSRGIKTIKPDGNITLRQLITVKIKKVTDN